MNVLGKINPIALKIGVLGVNRSDLLFGLQNVAIFVVGGCGHECDDQLPQSGIFPSGSSFLSHSHWICLRGLSVNLVIFQFETLCVFRSVALATVCTFAL